MPMLEGTVAWPSGTQTILVIVEPGMDAAKVRSLIDVNLEPEYGPEHPGIIVEQVVTYE